MISKIKIINYTFILFTLITVINGCKKKEDATPELETGYVSDIDGKVYKTVKIGDQWWMAEDLRTTRYRDSTTLYAVPPPPFDTTWSKFTTGVYCNNLDNQNSIIGVLYNWYAVNDSRGIAPKGWHIPTDAEWKQLEQNLGMSSADADNTGWRGSHEGEKLKVIRGSVGGWSDYGSVWATNESGFSAKAYGCRMFDGSWGYPGQGSTGFWWTATAEINSAWYRYLDYKNANVFRYYGPKTYGFSIRCVKD